MAPDQTIKYRMVGLGAGHKYPVNLSDQPSFAAGAFARTRPERI